MNEGQWLLGSTLTLAEVVVLLGYLDVHYKP